MSNLYAFTDPGAMKEYADEGEMLVKIGFTREDTDIRIKQQEGSANWHHLIKIGAWENLKNIKNDHDVHKILKAEGLHHTEGQGTEWFRIPATTLEEAYTYIDGVIISLEGKKVRKKVKMRQLQQRALDQAMTIINNNDDPTVIANLCPRFGKTIWSLMLFNELSNQHGNRVMLLPAYWLSVHSSFSKTLDKYQDFIDMREVNPNDEDAEDQAKAYLSQGLRLVIPISLHGSNLEAWERKHEWIRNIPNDDIFLLADEGDFGTHTPNQAKKLDFLFDI